ncbi:MAG: hypothetical protein K2X48_12990 [Chitinophagaceae bacterium]|nr:hypothetical protein [Chitinophagaceae bacterium]
MTIHSCGQFPKGYGGPLGVGRYVDYLKGFINSPKIVNNKKERLFNFLETYWENKPVSDQTDINLLYSKYQEWLKVFPFEISFFSHLKPYFEKQIPILKGKGDTNIYSGFTTFNIVSKDELLLFLSTVTKTIIKEINSSTLLQHGLLNNAKRTQIEIITANRKLQIEEIGNAKWSDRNGYIKILKKWLRGEKEFINEIVPLLSSLGNQENFIYDLIDGIKQLQENDTNAQCIINVRNDLPNKETSFRYWFKDFFKARYPDSEITVEEEKGEGRIDLKIIHKLWGTKIIEFKGWWNSDKSNIIKQTCSYLTDFEKDGYVFLINNLIEKDITQDYKDIVTNPDVFCTSAEWKEHKVGNTDFYYYQTSHKLGIKEKTLYHFIFNVHFSNTSGRKNLK